MIGTWDARVLGRLGVSTAGEYGEIILGPKVWAGRMGETDPPKLVVSATEILKILECSSRTGGAEQWDLKNQG